MSTTWYDAYWAGVKACVAAAWPEVRPGALSTRAEAEKRDWPNLINSGQIAAPFVVVDVDITPADGWSPCAVNYSLAATVFYVASDAAVDGTDTRIVPYLLGRLIALQDVILTGGLAVGTVLSEVTLSANATNPVNVSMQDSDQRYTAGSLTITTVVAVAPGE